MSKRKLRSEPVDIAALQAYKPKTAQPQLTPEQMAMMKGLTDPFAELPSGPEAVKWDAEVGMLPAHEEPDLDEDGEPVIEFLDEGTSPKVRMKEVPAKYMAILRFISPNDIKRVWLSREGIKKLQDFLVKVDDLLLEKETGLKVETTELMVPGQ